MKVCVSVHGRFHAFELARELEHQGCLAALLSTYPKTRTGVAAAVGAPWIEVWRRLSQMSPFDSALAQVGIARAFGRFAAANLPADADLLVGWSGATLEAIGPARDRGMRVVIERGSSHIRHQTRILKDAYERHGLAFDETPDEIIDRECAEYAAADAIAVPSGFAAETFVSEGIPEAKLIINPYGVDLTQFAPPPETRTGEKVRILFVGEVGIRKAVPELLDAFRPLAGRAELHLVGPVSAPVRPLIDLGPAEGVFLRGPLPRQALAMEYQRADIFCLPSWEEGFPLVLLQAMASGLPVIVSDATGAADIIEDGVDGRIIKAGDGAGLAAALETFSADAAARAAMGQVAAAKVAGDWSWAAYGARAVAHYRALLGDPVVMPTDEVEQSP